LSVTAGKDPLDATSSNKEVPNYYRSLKASEFKSLKTLTIGIPKEYFISGINPEISAAIKKAIADLKKAGCQFKEITLPHTEYAIAVYYIIQPAEVSSNLARYDGIRYGNKRLSFGDEAKRRIMLGTYTLSAGYYDAYYLKAMKVRSLISQDFIKAFEAVDLILAPVSPTPPFKIGEKTNDPLSMYLCDVFMSSASLAGIPSLALPCGFTKNNLPIGMQIIGPQFSEEKLFQLGYFYQQLTSWHKKKPEI
jgi:aspartyl-tRNA(Asn)/glutamyl-tRNA(Gln) amidotransferase subunit A